jgi:NitT/TauT family transport system substrate-binding protein
MIMRKVILCALALLTSMVTRADAEPIKLGYLPINSHTAFYAAELGLFKKHGVDVELTRFQAGPAMIQAMLSGALPAGDIGVVPMIHMASQKLPVYFLASDGIDTPKHPAGAIMVRPDNKDIKTFSDLKDRRIGQLALGTVTYMRLFAAAEKYGMAPDSVKQTFVPFPNMGTVLASGQVEAVYTWPPFDTLIESAGQGRVVMNDTDWNPYSAASGLVVRRDWADKNPELVIGLVKAWIEAGRWANDNPEKARQIAAKYLNLPDNIAAKMRMLYWPRNGYTVMPSVWDQINLMVTTKQLKPIDNIKGMVEEYWIEPGNRWITPALKEIGRQEDPYIEEVLKLRLPNLKGDPADFTGPWRY